MSAETRRKISEALKGKAKPPVSEATKMKMSESAKKRERLPFPEARRQNISKALMGHVVSEESRRKSGDAQRGKPKKKCLPDCQCGKHKSGWLAKTTYVVLTGQHDHPINIAGLLYEHRKIMYDVIGPGPHQCHWCERYLDWGGLKGIVVDHLNGNKRDNRLENLVPSCQDCNIRRRSPKVIIT